MGGSIRFRYEGDASSAIAEFERLDKIQKDLERQTGRVAKVSVDAAGRTNVALGKQLSTIKKVSSATGAMGRSYRAAGQVGAEAFGKLKGVLGAAGVGLALKQAISLQKEWNLEIANTIRSHDEVARKLQVQSLLSDKAFSTLLRKQVAPIAQRSATGLIQAENVSRELVSQGVGKQALPGVLKEILLGAKGTNAADPVEFGGSVIGFLKAFGKERSPENIRRTLVGNAALFNQTNFQASDLGQIAANASVLANAGVGETTARAGFTVLKDIGNLEPSRAATGLKNVTQILAGSGGNKLVSETLEKIGGPELQAKVDLIGESLPQALQTLSDAMDGLDKPSKNAALAKLFGRETAAAGQTLLGNIARIQELIDLQSDASFLERGVKIRTGGPAAAKTRLNNKKLLATLGSKREIANQEFIEAFEVAQIERDVPKVFRAISGFAKGTQSALGFDLQKPGPLEQDNSRNPVGKRAFGLLQTAGQAATLSDLDVDFPRAGVLTRNLPTGPPRSVDFLGTRKSLIDQKIEALESQRGRASVEAEKARHAATAPNSPGRGGITPGEKMLIDSLERIEDAINLQVQELKQQSSEKKAELRQRALSPTGQR